MKVLLVAVNAKYIHSNPAVYSLRAYAGEELGQFIEIAEYTINQHTEDILADIYERQPNVIAVSCYLWNISIVEILVRELAKLLPEASIWLGGPEVSYNASDVMRRFEEITGIMIGEGEETFRDLCVFYAAQNHLISNIGEANHQNEEGFSELSGILGIAYRDKSGRPVLSQPRGLTDLNKIPFLYNDDMFPVFENRIVYYESSRGCPFSCSYCLSSIDKSVRFRDIELVKRELRFFLDRRVPQVKFVDRTFNCSHEHALGIWTFLKENDNGITNFHFEIAADLLNGEELALLHSLRPGLIQLEIGVQSTNPETIREIRRSMDFDRLSVIVKRIQAGHNIHEHLDLIAGLPFEDYKTFIQSFNDVMSLEPEQMQLGFLKVLKGSFLHKNAERYGLACMDVPPYEVLYTKWISYKELRKLKAVEEMVELYYNSCQFRHALTLLKQKFEDFYSMYEAIAEFYRDEGHTVMNPSRIRRYEILLEFVQKRVRSDSAFSDSMREALTLDLYLREKVKNRPEFCTELNAYKDIFRRWYSREAKEHRYLSDYKLYNAKQIASMTHIEIVGGRMLLFDYMNRNPLTKDARIVEIEEDYGEME